MSSGKETLYYVNITIAPPMQTRNLDPGSAKSKSKKAPEKYPPQAPEYVKLSFLQTVKGCTSGIVDSIRVSANARNIGEGPGDSRR